MGGEFLNLVVDGQSVPLDRDRLTIGKDPVNDVVLTDPTVSRLHAVIELDGTQHVITDLGSKNGTSVNGEPVTGRRILQLGDEIRLGKARMVYRASTVGSTETAGVAPRPELTADEHAVLVELCRPLRLGTVFTEPAPTAEIARALGLPDAVVDGRLYELCALFGVDPDAEHGRALLASAAVERGAVRLAELER